MSGSVMLPLSINGTQFRLDSLFPTPVAIAPVNEAEALNVALRPTILAHRDRHPGVRRTNAGGWQSVDDFASWSGPDGARLMALVRGLADGLTGIDTGDGLQRQPLDWKVNAWANVNGPDCSNHPHHHPGAYWSGVYWVDAGGDDGADAQGGELEMLDPRGILPAFMAPSLRYAAPGCLSAGLSEFLQPRSGTVVLFPSWLVHAVRPYRGSRERISVAFNFAP